MEPLAIAAIAAIISRTRGEGAVELCPALHPSFELHVHVSTKTSNVPLRMRQ